ncbi:MAG: LytR/AlgR family response regulator transcription factor [Gammaproteobacteria bacterium]
MRILIADADKASRSTLLEALALASDASVIAECGDGREVMPACVNSDVDLMFLDMALPRISEFWQAYAAFSVKPAYLASLVEDEAAALYALGQGAMDFMFKPVTPGGVKQAIIKLRYVRFRDDQELQAREDDRLDLGEFSRLLHSAAEHIFRRQRPLEFGKLAVKVGTRIRMLKLMHVMYARAAGDYVDISLSTGERIHIKDQLTNPMSRLPAPQFVRTHRSFILNREYVKEIRAKDNDYELVLTDDTVITSGSAYRQEVRQQFLLNAAWQ